MRKGLKLGLMLGAALTVATAGIASGAEVKQINGAGASFPYPIYSKWAAAYNEATGVRLNYQSIGSGGGIKQIKAKTVDFGASDAPLTKDELDEAGLMQFPMIVGGVVPVINVPGIKPGEMKLTNEELADIFLGKIKKWNDPELAKMNPGLNLPDLAIQVVHRSDGSGTTWIYTNYLSKVSPEWKKNVGNGKAVNWPTGVGGKGNEGVASYVSRLKGGIGYVEFAYALQNKMTHVALRNREGNFVQPKIENFQAAAAGADWANAPGFRVVLTDQPGAKSWPISGASFILMHHAQKDADTARAVLKFLDWSYHNGQGMAKELDYVPLPASVISLVEKTWAKELKGPNGEQIWTQDMTQK
ncbi:MAG: phosphate ABC transporter substrate-binding protein PstS [Ectothiorhodospiraceae bacterium]|jgi:phosphate transport system substrate-binding protein